MLKLSVVVFLALFLAGCGSIRIADLIDEVDGPDQSDIEVSSIDNAVPKAEPYSKTGNSTYSVYGKVYQPLKSSEGFVETGIASWYGKKFHGKRTSSGEVYDMHAMTAAHKTLPLPTYVKVTNLNSGATAVVKVNDRGPFVGKRIIDLSYAAAKKLDIVQDGTGPVRVEAISTASAPSVSTGGGNQVFYLQAGSFRSKSNAENLRRELKSHGIKSIRVKTGFTGGAKLYRVQIGPLQNSQDAEAIISKLSGVLPGRLHIVSD